MADTKWLEIAVNTTPDKLDEVCAKLAAAGMIELLQRRGPVRHFGMRGYDDSDGP